MPEKKPNPLTALVERGNKTHAGLLAIIAIYFIYMAWQMVQNTLSGASTMSLTTTIVFAAIMVLVAIAIGVYAVLIYLHCKKREEDETE